jgi:hypothetical protein
MITLPAEAISDIGTIISEFFASFWPVIGLALGLPLGFWLLNNFMKLSPGFPEAMHDTTNHYNSDVDVAILKLSRLKYESGQMSQDEYEKILKKYS